MPHEQFFTTELRVENILVPTDFSDCSKNSLVYAANIARRHHSKLTLLHIVPPRVPLLTDYAAERQTRREALDRMKKLRDEFLSKASFRDIRVRLVVRRGTGWDVISKMLLNERTDLIVLGTNARTGLKKLILGSFAEQVFRNSPCPVVTVGPRVDEELASEYPEHILFPTDDSLASKAAEPYAYRLGREPGAKLTLLGVIHGKSSVNERLIRTLERLQATGLYAAWREGGATPDVVADAGPNVKAILRTAERTLADLIILAISEDGDEKLGWADAYEVVCSAPCPVLTVRNTFPDPYFKRLMAMEPVRRRVRSSTPAVPAQ